MRFSSQADWTEGRCSRAFFTAVMQKRHSPFQGPYKVSDVMPILTREVVPRREVTRLADQISEPVELFPGGMLRETAPHIWGSITNDDRDELLRPSAQIVANVRHQMVEITGPPNQFGQRVARHRCG